MERWRGDKKRGGAGDERGRRVKRKRKGRKGIGEGRREREDEERKRVTDGEMRRK